VLAGFKKFILRGSVVDLAVGIVIGAAFGAVVTSFVNDVLMQFVGAIFGKPSFNQLSFTINKSQIRYGNFLTALITFVITAAALYFVVVAPLNYFNDRRRARQGEPEDLTNDERMIELLEQIATK
jgi:large conductance mechanosensitive channel